MFTSLRPGPECGVWRDGRGLSGPIENGLFSNAEPYFFQGNDYVIFLSSLSDSLPTACKQGHFYAAGTASVLSSKYPWSP